MRMLVVIVGALVVAAPGCKSKSDEAAVAEPEPQAEPAGEATDEAPAAEPAAESAVTPELRADLEDICNAIERSGADPSDSAATLEAVKWIESEIETDQARTLMQGLAAMSQAERSQALQDEAKRAGLSACPLAEHWAEPATP